MYLFVYSMKKIVSVLLSVDRLIDQMAIALVWTLGSTIVSFFMFLSVKADSMFAFPSFDTRIEAYTGSQTASVQFIISGHSS